MATNSTVDQAKGRVKEAVGALTDDDKLRNEGKVDQFAGKAKDAASNLVDKAKNAVEDLGRKRD